MHEKSRIRFICFLCLVLILLNGCIGVKVANDGIPTLTPAEQAEVDKYINDYGREAIPRYLGDRGEKDTDEIVFKYLKYFVAQGADVNARYNRRLYLVGRFPYDDVVVPLVFAADRGNIEIVKFLVSQGADISAKGNYDYTPLHAAAGKGNLEFVEFLVSQGADINAKGYADCTPLHEAASNGNLEVVKFLVSQGADVNATATLCPLEDEESIDITEGEEIRATPLDWARGRQNSKVVEYLSSLE